MAKVHANSRWKKQCELTQSFIDFMERVQQWQSFEIAWTRRWQAQGATKGPLTARQVAREAWDDMKDHIIALPPDVDVFRHTAEGTEQPAPKEQAVVGRLDKYEPKAVKTEKPLRIAPQDFAIPNDVDFRACVWWAVTHAKAKQDEILDWRSQTAAEFLDMWHEDRFKFMSIFSEYFVTQAVVDRGGRVDDGKTETDLLHEIAKIGKPEGRE